MWPLFEGRTYLPTNASASCTVGGYISYAVNVSKVEIQLAVNLARNADIRLVVKSTGHAAMTSMENQPVLVLWTVGVAGGYVLGGSHSPMSSVYGLAADQVLALEVVLANGRFVTVIEESDRDSFWALRGGGGGTYGVVTSLISCVYPKVGVTVSTFNFSTGKNVSVETWAGVRSYLS